MSQFQQHEWEDTPANGTQGLTAIQEALNLSELQPVNDPSQHLTQDVPTVGLQPVQVQQTSDAPLTGVYSSSGFDMVGILSRLVNRYI